jgi:uncharacterized membrane protein YfcA
MIELLFLGTGVGVLSGFLGIGGGTILIPILLILGFETKEAIGISVVQMVFSSIYGSYLNNKKGTLDIPLVLIIGMGGFFGAFMSGYVAALVDAKVLEVIFLAFVIFAIIRMLFIKLHEAKEKEMHKISLFLIGSGVGLMSMTVGIGGSIMLVPILVSFLHVELKKAVSAGLFFVVFSSISGLISHFLNGHIDFKSGVIIGFASLFGVYIGIHLKDKVSNILQKRVLVGFYLLIVIYLINRIFIHV